MVKVPHGWWTQRTGETTPGLGAIESLATGICGNKFESMTLRSIIKKSGLGTRWEMLPHDCYIISLSEKATLLLVMAWCQPIHHAIRGGITMCVCRLAWDGENSCYHTFVKILNAIRKGQYYVYRTWNPKIQDPTKPSFGICSDKLLEHRSGGTFFIHRILY